MCADASAEVGIKCPAWQKFLFHGSFKLTQGTSSRTARPAAGTDGFLNIEWRGAEIPPMLVNLIHAAAGLWCLA